MPCSKPSSSDRQAAIARRDGDAEGARELATRTRDVPAAQARDLVRAFSTWFEMVNMAEKVHRIRRRRQYLNEGTTQPGGIVEAVTRAQGAGARARRHPPADDRDLDRAGVHRASHRIDATHDPAQAAEDRAAAARPARPVAHGGGNAPDLGSHPRRDHSELADGGELARAPHASPTSASTCCSSSSRSCSRSCRSSTRRSKRRWSRSYGAGGARARAARDPALRLLGRRRHGRQSGRARQDDPRNRRAPSADHRQPLLPRMPGSRRDAVAERDAHRHLGRAAGAHRAVHDAAAGRQRAVAGAARSHAVSRVPRPDHGAAARHLRWRAPITTSRPTSSSAT